MQRRLSGFKGYTIEAPDGNAGSVCDILFQDNDWKLRWFVINTGSWLFGNRLLLRPAALGPADIRQHAFAVTLTKAEVEASADENSDMPVFQQMEQSIDIWDNNTSIWDVGQYGGFGYGASGGTTYDRSGSGQNNAGPSGDPHLRSMTQVTGYAIHALDGDIGHVEDFLVNDETWQIEAVVIDTKNWGAGKHVLVPAPEIKAVDWDGKYIRIDQTRYAIKCGPSWQEADWSGPALT
jgi:hypothetical protein